MSIITTTQAAKILGVNASTVSRLAQDGYIKSSRLKGTQGKAYAFDPDDIKEFAKTYSPKKRGAAIKNKFNPEVHHIEKRDKLTRQSSDEMIARNMIRVANNGPERLVELRAGLR